MKEELTIIFDGEWQNGISDAFEEYMNYAYCGNYHETQFDIQDPCFRHFLDTIWETSLTAFDIPREVQVVIDGMDNCYLSVGTPGFVSFLNQDEQLYGKGGTPLTLPIKCWIHTHPFGAAYFSGTDWTTINTWKPIMDMAIVLGNNQLMVWENNDNEDTTFYINGQLAGEEE